MGKKKKGGKQKRREEMNEVMVTERKSRERRNLSKHDPAALIQPDECSTMEVWDCELCNTDLQL